MMYVCALCGAPFKAKELPVYQFILHINKRVKHQEKIKDLEKKT